jgi:hypothetical protein
MSTNESKIEHLKRYTEEEFCRIVGIGLRTARRLRQNGELTHGRTGRKIWYTQAHIERYYSDHTVYAGGKAA